MKPLKTVKTIGMLASLSATAVTPVIGQEINDEPIDVMYAITPRAAESRGGGNQISAAIMMAHMNTQELMRNSNLPASLGRARLIATSYDDTNKNQDEILDDLFGNVARIGDADSPSVRFVANNQRIDLVQLVGINSNEPTGNTTGTLGVAFINGNYSFSNSRGIGSNLITPHEFGHNFGGRHANSSTFVNDDEQTRNTIMVATIVPAETDLVFSGPDLTFNGGTTGSADKNNLAAAVGRTPVISRFNNGFLFGDQVALMGNNGRFVSSENAFRSMRSNRNAVGSWESFVINRAPDPNTSNDISIQATINSRFVSTNNGRRFDVRADRASVGAWERYQVDLVPGTNRNTFEGNRGFLSSENGSNNGMSANRAAVGAWEQFKIFRF